MPQSRVICISGQGAERELPLSALATPDLAERARADTNAWIKRLRLVPYNGISMRERFRYRDDSLWWFTELYLQKMRQLDQAVVTVLTPIYETDFLGFSYGFRPGRNQHQALDALLVRVDGDGAASEAGELGS